MSYGSVFQSIASHTANRKKENIMGSINGEKDRKQKGIEVKLNTCLDGEKVFLPAQPLVSKVEEERVFNLFDIVGKEYISKFDVERLSPSHAVTDNFYEHFPSDASDKRIERKEFRQGLEQLASKIAPLSLCERIFISLEDPSCSMFAYCNATFLLGLIIISSLAFVLESMPEFKHTDIVGEEPHADHWFEILEIICIAAFTVDYFLRLFCVSFVRDLESLQIRLLQYFDDESDADEEEQEAVLHAMKKEDESILRGSMHGGMKLVRYFLSPLNMIDFVAIFPFYLEACIGAGGGNLVFLRVLRLARVCRVFKLGKYNENMQMFGSVMVESMPALNVLGFFCIMSMIVFGSAVYFAEVGTWTTDDILYPDGVYMRDNILGNDKEVSPFDSIPASFWWVLVTSTTVGYGDFTPTSPSGKLVATFCMINGVLILALPITIIGANFSAAYEAQEARHAESARQMKIRQARVMCWSHERYAELLTARCIGIDDLPRAIMEECVDLTKKVNGVADDEAEDWTEGLDEKEPSRQTRRERAQQLHEKLHADGSYNDPEDCNMGDIYLVDKGREVEGEATTSSPPEELLRAGAGSAPSAGSGGEEAPSGATTSGGPAAAAAGPGPVTEAALQMATELRLQHRELARGGAAPAGEEPRRGSGIGRAGQASDSPRLFGDRRGSDGDRSSTDSPRAAGPAFDPAAGPSGRDLWEKVKTARTRRLSRVIMKTHNDLLIKKDQQMMEHTPRPLLDKWIARTLLSKDSRDSILAELDTAKQMLMDLERELKNRWEPGDGLEVPPVVLHTLRAISDLVPQRLNLANDVKQMRSAPVQEMEEADEGGQLSNEDIQRKIEQIGSDNVVTDVDPELVDAIRVTGDELGAQLNDDDERNGGQLMTLLSSGIHFDERMREAE